MTTDPYSKKSWRRIIGVPLLFGVAGVLVLSALTFSIAGGLGLIGPNFGHIYAIVVLGFSGFFVLGLTQQVANTA